MRGLSAVSTVSGIDALALVVEFARQLPSAQFSFVRYKPSLSVENRVLGIAPVKLEALPAADLVNLVRHRPDVVSELLRHDPVAEDAQTTRLFARDILSGALEELRRSLHVDEALGVRSECRFPDGEVLHLQLMDFRVEPSAEALAGLVAAIQKAVPSGGLILESGRSYHFYGSELLAASGWIAFMARCLLLSPLTDPRYIAHRLLAGFGVLRLTASTRKPMVPRVVTTV